MSHSWEFVSGQLNSAIVLCQSQPIDSNVIGKNAWGSGLGPVSFPQASLIFKPMSPLDAPLWFLL